MSRRNVGRPPKEERANRCCMVRFSETKFARFLTLYELSGVPNRVMFGQFRAIGVNYNQVTVALKSHFTEKKAVSLLAKLEKRTIELAVVGGEIVQLTNEFREKQSPK